MVKIILGDTMRILITGASSGIGYKLGKELIKRGHTVYLTTHTDKELVTLKAKLLEEKLDALSFKMDITTKDINLVDKLKIDCLINNASIGIGGSILDMSIKHLKENYNVNIFSSFKLIQKVYKNMLKDKINGKIFIISSLSYYINLPFLGCYTSSKASISTLTKTLQKEIKYLDNNIKISLIELGAYKTGFNDVMIDNKDKYQNKNKLFNYNRITKLQKKFFKKIESSNYKPLINKLIRNIESKNPKKIIKKPKILSIFTKIYLLFH